MEGLQVNGPCSADLEPLIGFGTDVCCQPVLVITRPYPRWRGSRLTHLGGLSSSSVPTPLAADQEGGSIVALHRHAVTEPQFMVSFEHDDAQSWHRDRAGEDHDHPTTLIVGGGRLTVEEDAGLETMHHSPRSRGVG
jgi:hypothetical protein